MSSSPGGCDKGVESMASQRGGEKFSAGDFNAALGYYQDALAACPNDDRAEVNVARAYEALGNKVSAIKYYRKAADTGGPTETDAEEEARASLATPSSRPPALKELAMPKRPVQPQADGFDELEKLAELAVVFVYT